jgi:tetratricopeptide (TPR) repeat protein
MLYVCLALITVALYWPVRQHEFVAIDDPEYVVSNPQVNQGLKPASLLWAFTHTHSSNWHPLTWISHMADCQIFGLKPAGHHLVNVLLHALNTCLLFGWLQGVTGARWRSAIVAGLFAWHPLHVESVAWISERKDVLSAAFWFLTLMAYDRYTRQGSRKWYGIALALFALGLMAKPMLVTLPCVLLLLDFWPLGRWGAKADTGAGARVATGSVWREKIPFFALSLISCVITFLAQRHGGAVVAMSKVALPTRLANGLVAYQRYLEQTFWPTDLAVIYPHPVTLPGRQVIVALVLLICVTAFALRYVRRAPFLTVGWLWFLGTLVPVIGLVQVGGQAMADRYTYLPLVGIFIALAWGGQELASRWSWPRPVTGVASGLALAACLVITHRQLPVWHDTLALFEHAAKVVPHNHVAHSVVGEQLILQGRIDEGAAHFKSALTIFPRYTEALQKWGQALAFKGRHQEALDLFTRALALQPAEMITKGNLANTLLALGRADEAKRWYEEIIREKPELGETYSRLGNALVLQGKIDEALVQYQKGLGLSPADPAGYVGRGIARLKQRQVPEAVADFKRAIELQPQLVDGHLHLAKALVASGKAAEAVPEFNEALRLDPKRSDVRANLSAALSSLERFDEATVQLEQVLREDPQHAAARTTLGILLVRTGRVDEAIPMLRESLQANPDQAEAQFALGMAMFRKRVYPEAIQCYRKAAALDPNDADTHYNLALTLAASGDVTTAAASFREAARCRTNWPAPCNALAWILATHPDANVRNGAEAETFAHRAVQLSPTPNAMYLNTLAAAQAEVGKYDEAVINAQRAVATAMAGNQAANVAQYQARLQLYQQRQPYRDPTLTK